jgi:hypothetical protein
MEPFDMPDLSGITREDEIALAIDQLAHEQEEDDATGVHVCEIVPEHRVLDAFDVFNRGIDAEFVREWWESAGESAITNVCVSE